MRLPDLFLVIFLAVAFPLIDYYLVWRHFLERSRVDPHRARRSLYGLTLAQQWLLAGIAAFVWMNAGRSMSAIGLVVPEGWRLALSLLLIGGFTFLYVNSFRKIARNPALLPKVRKQLHNVEAMLPHTTGDLRLFMAISITAGLCEEFLFRGFWIGALSPVLSWWGAAALNVPVFGLLHAYQGRNGIIRTALGGLVLTLVVAVTRSLLPAMAIHAMIDVVSGFITWTAMQAPAEPPAIPAAQ